MARGSSIDLAGTLGGEKPNHCTPYAPREVCHLAERDGYYSPRSLLWLLICCLLLVTIPGCGGCHSETAAEQQARLEKEEKERQEKEKEREKKKKDEPKDDFIIGSLLLEPNESQLSRRGVKPGHWIGVTQSMQANRADFQGDVNWQLVNGEGQPVDVPRVPTTYTFQVSRPLSLALQKPPAAKEIETTLFVPGGLPDIRYAGQLTSSSLGVRWPLPSQPFSFLPQHEYYLVVLAHEPLRYSFLKRCDAVVPRVGDEYTPRLAYYDVLMPPENKPVPLSPNALTWTSIAYLVWDDMPPDRLSDKQQRALIEWLHWGGQLLVSGPDSLDSLRGSFLAPYLPAESTGTATADTAALKSLNAAWIPHSRHGAGRPLTAIHPWSTVALKPRDVPGAEVLAATPAGEPLVVEGNVGRGRIVVTGFRLRERELTIWPAFDDFFNGCLLRRSPRVYSFDGPQQQLRIDWAGHKDELLDPRRVTTLWMFSRDAGYVYSPDVETAEGGHPLGGPVPVAPDATPRLSLGAWNDNSAVANGARQTIQDAAGIEIPSPEFVMWVLVGYLTVLVPLNWVVFRMIGRIEWAWIAAPLIAVAGAALVVRLAQLDIGFARSRTEVAVLETQPGYARGHLTRFVALYTSLSTPYTCELDDAGGLVQPFSAAEGGGNSGAADEIDERREDKVTMRGFHVISNRADLLRAEQMVDLGGAITLVPSVSSNAAVLNKTRHKLHGAVAVRRVNDHQWEAAWLGDIEPGETGDAKFEEITRDALVRRWQNGSPDGATPQTPSSSTSTSRPKSKALTLERLVQAGLDTQNVEPGDVRMFASIAGGPLPGITIRPVSSQLRAATLVVANLKYAPRPKPQPDSNTRADIVAARDADAKQPPDGAEPENKP